MTDASDDPLGAPSPAAATAPPGASESLLAPWARTTLIVLFLMNLLNYTDRWVLSAVLEDIQKEFHLDDYQAGWFFTWFLVSYSLVSPVMVWLGDRTKRTYLLALGVGIWSIATVGTGLAKSYNQIVLARSLLGIGEATYGVLAPALLMDLFPRKSRSSVMSFFYIAMPVGGALGMTLGAYIAKHHGWAASFFIVGAPGLVAAILTAFLPEPIRGFSEGVSVDKLKAHEAKGLTKDDYLDLLVNSSYNYSVLAQAMYSFAIGGLAAFLPKFLTSYRGIERVEANFKLGVTTALAAVLGMTIGGWLADKLAKRTPRALFLVPAFAMLLSVPFVFVGLFSTNHLMIFGGIFLAEMMMFINTGPCNAIIANVTLPAMRTTAFGVAALAVHFVLGDVWSPPLIGYVSRMFGDPDTMKTSIGQFLTSVGAVPIPGASPKDPPQNLLAGLLIVVPALVLSGIVMLAGARHLPREMALMLAQLRANPDQLPSRKGATRS